MPLTSLARHGRPDARFQTLLSLRAASLLGAFGAVASVLIADLPTVGLALGCASVAILYGVYPAFSLAWGTARERAVEWTYLVVGVVTIVLALEVDARWLAAGWALHGIWDVLHHRRHQVVGLRGIPAWWIQGCLVWDIPAGVGLLLALG